MTQMKLKLWHRIAIIAAVIFVVLAAWELVGILLENPTAVVQIGDEPGKQGFFRFGRNDGQSDDGAYGDMDGDTNGDTGNDAQGGGEGTEPEEREGYVYSAEYGYVPLIDEDFRLLVNRENPVSESFKPQDLELAKYRASNRSESGQYMVKQAAEAFNALSEAAAAEEDYTIVVTTAYRSYSFQKTLHDNYVAKDGQAAADTYSARPGTSEHQSGLAADVSSPSVNYELTQRYADSEEGKWLAENCSRFGFIIRFPLDKDDITGYMYEPWHIRYVGEEPAAFIMNNGLTLEEYFELITPTDV